MKSSGESSQSNISLQDDLTLERDVVLSEQRVQEYVAENVERGLQMLGQRARVDNRCTPCR